MDRHIVITAVGACLVLQGCSSRPRAFTPTLAAAPADRAAFDAAYATREQLLVAGKLDSSGRMASAGAGAAAGATAAAVGGVTAAGVAGYGGMAVMAGTVVLLPFAIVGGAFGLAKMKKTKKEKAIATAMNGCLKERGHVVTGWVKTGKKARARPAAPTPSTSF